MLKVVGSSPASPAIFKNNRFGWTWSEYLGNEDCPYLRRWIFNLKFFSIRLHRWYSSDDKRCFHDHPWWFFTVVLAGGYVDSSEGSREQMRPGTWRFRKAMHRHTVRVRPKGCWTLLVCGPETRRWGFYVKGAFYKAINYFNKFGHHPCDQ